mgnify:CR=1 FL=1
MELSMSLKYTCSQHELGCIYPGSTLENFTELVAKRFSLPDRWQGNSIICNINPNKTIEKMLKTFGFRKIAQYRGDGQIVYVMFWTNNPITKKQKVKKTI